MAEGVPIGFLDGLLLFASAVCGGALNSVAGGGSFFTFPALVFLGVPPVTANATSAVALWPGSVASASAYRKDLHSTRRFLLPFSIASLLGGLAGALLLLRTSNEVFDVLIPWLLLVATLVFAFGGQVVSRVRKDPVDTDRPQTTRAAVVGFLVQLVIATYGGFFGGGMGIMMLATFTILGLTDIHAMNGLKNWMATFINGIAVATFIVAGAIYWPQTAVMLVGAIAGGYGGASSARRLNPLYVRRFVIALGFGLSAYFFYANLSAA